MQDGFVASFSGRLRDECLNEHESSIYALTKNIIETGRNACNYIRPHPSFKGPTPIEFVIWSKE